MEGTNAVSEGLKALTSPAKLAFGGYVLLVALGKLDSPRPWVWLLISLLFVAAEVFHNDYLRIVLNKRAERRSQR